MFGKLTLAAIPFDQPIVMVTCGFIVIGIAGVLGLITYLRRWEWLWREWLTSVDHKRIGVMYTLLALVMLLRGFSDAVLMRSQQALVGYNGHGYLPPEHFDQIFSAHGTIMIFFMAMPLVVGLMNFVVPLQIGARDVAFPVLNSISFWLTAAGALLVNISLGVGEFSRAGWLAYPPLSELSFSPGVGVDYYLWALQISGIGTLLSAVNLLTTIMKMRAPGMALNTMPVFTWTALAANMLIIASFPVLTGTLAMLLLDRYADMHFFTNGAGGNPMMFINLIWTWGHPEVYILAVPAFGMFSEIIATFSGKPLFGYRSMVIATMAITLMAFTTWLHHFFTMGAGADVNTVLRHHDHAHRHSHGRQSIQLAVYHVRRADSLHLAGAVDHRLHGDVHDRRHDRRADGGTPGGLHPAQQSVSDRPFSQCHHRRRWCSDVWPR